MGIKFTGLARDQYRFFSIAFVTTSSQTSAPETGIMDELRHDEPSFKPQSFVCSSDEMLPQGGIRELARQSRSGKDNRRNALKKSQSPYTNSSFQRRTRSSNSTSLRVRSFVCQNPATVQPPNRCKSLHTLDRRKNALRREVAKRGPGKELARAAAIFFEEPPLSRV